MIGGHVSSDHPSRRTPGGTREGDCSYYDVNLLNVKRLEASKEMVEDCLRELYIKPRLSLEKWSKITEQTMQVRLAYPGQHLASVITGIRGSGTAARGDDLSDRSEVKTCSRADQLGVCRACPAKVLVWQEECPECGSRDIDIKTDSHWIINIPSENELDRYLNKIPRMVLILFDRPEQATNAIRVRAWTIDPRHPHFQAFLKDYYYNNYLKKVQQGQNPAPCNLHPLQYDFYMMDPGLIFEAYLDIENDEVSIGFWNSDDPKMVPIPSRLLTKEQLEAIFPEGEILQALENLPDSERRPYTYANDPAEVKMLQKKDYVKLFPEVPQEKREMLQIREKRIKSYKTEHRRGG